MQTVRVILATIVLATLALPAGAPANAGEALYRDTVIEVHFPVADAKPLPVEEAGLDDQTRTAMRMLAQAAAEHPSFVGLPPSRRREIHDAVYGTVGLPNEDITDVEERFIPGSGDYKIRVRIYTPRPRPEGALPIMAYYHGGGMMMGSLEQYEPIARRFSQKSGAVVVSVDYRMAPEYKNPVALDDSYAALVWTRDNAASLGADPHQLVIAGDSAGGMIAATLAQMARDQNGPEISYQILIYPAVGTLGHSRSMVVFGEGYVFGRGELEWAYGSWINSAEELNSPRVQPILAKDFSNLPPAYVASAEYEIMRDDIEEYARLLREAGVATVHHRFEGTVHPFMSMAGVIDAGKTVIDEASANMRQGLGLTPN